jgi:hypothetical protein
MELSRKDQFALAAMQGFIINTGSRNIPNIEWITDKALQTANLMIEKLDNDNPNTKKLLCEEVKLNVGDREIL